MQKRNINIIKKTFPYIKPYMFENVLSIVLNQISVLFLLGIPLVIKFLIDDIIPKNNWNELPKFIIFMVIFTIGGQVFSYLSSYLYAKFSESIYSDSRNALFKKIIKKNLSFFDKISNGDIVTRLMQDSGYLHTILSYVLSQIIINIFKILVAFIILLKMNYVLAFIVLLTVPIFLWLNKKYGKKLRKQVTIAREYNSTLSNIYINALNNIKLIKNFSTEDLEFKKSEKINNDAKNIQIKTESTGYFMHEIMSICTSINQLIVLCIGAYFVYSGSLTLGGLVAFNSYLSHIYKPFLDITSVNSSLNRAIVCVKRYFEFDNNNFEEDFDRGATNNINKGIIKLEGVDFAYNDDIILKNINFNIYSKEKVLLTGKSGQGKSTIFSILKRLYPIKDGKVYIDDKDINTINLKSLRKNIFCLSQDNMFFEGSIRENFLKINDKLTDENIWEALNKVKMGELISKAEYNGLDTNLTKNASAFSGGQKQRLSLSRIFIQNNKIVILDEPFTGIDNETANIIWDNMKNYLQDSTVIFVDHNFKDDTYFDKILKLEDCNINMVELNKN